MGKGKKTAPASKATKKVDKHGVSAVKGSNKRLKDSPPSEIEVVTTAKKVKTQTQTHSYGKVDRSAARPTKLDDKLKEKPVDASLTEPSMVIKPMVVDALQTKTTLVYNAKRFVFPNQKFLNDSDEMCDPDNEATLAYFLAKRSNVPKEEMVDWWKNNFKYVIKAFNGRRNYYTNIFKEAFLGKYMIMLCVSFFTLLQLIILLFISEDMKKNGGKPRYSKDDYEQAGRLNEEYFFHVVDTFFCPMKGKTVFGPASKVKLISDIITVSDEVFFILTMENNYDRWVKQYEIDQQPNKDELKNEVWGPYTKCGKGNTGFTRRSSGWSSDAITRYNYLCEVVEGDRQADLSLDEKNSVERKYLAARMESNSPVKPTKTKEEESSPPRRPECKSYMVYATMPTQGVESPAGSKEEEEGDDETDDEDEEQQM